MKKWLWLLCFSILLFSCNKNNKIEVIGNTGSTTIECRFFKEEKNISSYTINIERVKDIKRRKHYLNTEFSNDVFLVHNLDTLAPVFLHVEENGGLLPYDVVIVGFENKSRKNEKLLLKGTEF